MNKRYLSGWAENVRNSFIKIYENTFTDQAKKASEKHFEPGINVG